MTLLTHLKVEETALETEAEETTVTEGAATRIASTAASLGTSLVTAEPEEDQEADPMSKSIYSIYFEQ